MNEVERLRRENEILKGILKKNKIDFEEQILPKKEKAEVGKESISDEDVVLFYSLFRCRKDVYSKRSAYPDRKTGKVGYYVQMGRGADGEKYRLPLTGKVLKEHLLGRDERCADVVGGYPLTPDDKCYFLVIDFDNHTGEEIMYERVKKDVSAVRKFAEKNNVPIYIERSRSGNGMHIWMFFKEAVEAAVARRFGFLLMNKSADDANLLDFLSYDRMIPAQDFLSVNWKTKKKGIGNMVALPLQGRALKNGNSAFLDEDWIPYSDQWEFLRSIKKIDKDFLLERIEEWREGTADNDDVGSPEFKNSDVEGAVEIIRRDQVYVKKENLKLRLQNQIRRVAAFSNPEFYRKRAMGYSTYDTPRVIFCSYDEGDYICLPRGMYEELIAKFDEAEIEYNVSDKRNIGRKIRVKFKGELYDEQNIAVKKVLEKDNGVLSATTAFGKTVVGANIIARKKRNALVLVHTKEIMKNWQKDLAKFLEIDEPLPEYVTQTGRKKTRDSLIGVITATCKNVGGIIDIAMISSLGKPGEINELVKKYGLVIMDECHHGPSQVASAVLESVNAKYVYGFTATWKRKDGLEKKMLMEFGPILHEYGAKERLEKTKFDSIVIPRFTNFKTEFGTQIYDVYEAAINDVARNEMIIEDVIESTLAGRSGLVVTRYRKHAEEIFDRLKGKLDGRVFLLTGGLSAKGRDEVWEKMKEARGGGFVLVSTGQLVGEGFNLPRLDTLFMATPVSWSGLVEQYLGRLHRDYEGKQTVAVYDYVDKEVPVFYAMFRKRLKTYGKIGYRMEELKKFEWNKNKQSGLF